jgi:uncharacterized hydrophobic protein (TIGR00271 family)
LKPIPWYRVYTSPNERASIIAALEEGSEPRSTYFVLLVLSTLIATFGLLANSTATVIGAMLLAPLMGPILGLGYALVKGDPKTILTALSTEILGVLACVGTSMLVAFVVSSKHIDYSVSEIVSRTDPTLYDLAIGLAAGLAGGYTSVRPRIHSSIAGVAISVALVPPLAVVGLCTVGTLSGDVPWGHAGKAGILFLTNFLTIELAAAMVFLSADFHPTKPRASRLWGPVAAQLALLFLTSIFLYHQLNYLVLERGLRSQATAILQAELKQIPGAAVDRLTIDLNIGQSVDFVASVTSREDIGPSLVAEYQRTLQTELGPMLAGGERISLVVQTIRSSYASATSDLYLPKKAPESSHEVMYQTLESAIRKTLRAYQNVNLAGFEFHEEKGTIKLLVSLDSPYRFDRFLVSDFQEQLKTTLSAEGTTETIELSVRATINEIVSAYGVGMYSPPDSSVREALLLEQEETCKELLSENTGRHFGYRFVSCHLVQPLDKPDKLVVRAIIQGPRLLEPFVVKSWESELTKILSKRGKELEVSLEVECRIGGVVLPEVDTVPAKIRQKLQELAQAKGGRVLEPQIHLEGDTYHVFCQIILPDRGEDTIASEWAASLRRVTQSKVVLKAEVLTGQVFQSK